MPSSLNRKLIRDLAHARGPILAVAGVIACAVTAFVALGSTYQSLLESQSLYYAEYRFADVFAQLERAPDSLAAQIGAIPGVARVETRVVRDVTLDVPGLDEPAVGRLVSVPGRERPILNDIAIRRGRYVSPGRTNEAIASEAFAEANHLDLGSTIGAVVNGRWEKLVIVGVALSPEYVYEVKGGGTIFPDNRRFGVLWASREMLAPAFGMQGAFNDVSLSLAPGVNEAEVIARLDQLLARYGGLGAYGRGDQISYRFLTDEIAQNRASATIVPAIFLAAAAFLLYTVLSRLIATQRAQVGTLKAFGYSNVAVAWHYLKMALVAVAGGLVAGVAAGAVFGLQLTHIYTLFYRFPLLHYRFGAGLIVLASLVSFAAAALGAVGAVRRAVQLPPAEAMRPPAPARYRAGWLERLGIDRHVPLVGRMIARDIERRPWRAAFTAMGIAISVAILVVGFYFFDAIDYLMRLQFQTVQREDVTVMFSGPRSAGSRYSLATLPGVLRVEPFRSVAARVSYGHRSRRAALMARPASGILRPLVDQDLRVHPLPPEGIVLTGRLGELLGVKPGGVVTVEVLEGARPVWRVPVSSLVEEPIGLSAYMDLDALNRLLHEGGTTSGAFLSVDAAQAPRLYSLLKRMPSVSGISVRQATLQSFQETLAKSMAISTTVLVVLACTLAFGMVYNGIRIALSERGRELASLRVLGFGRGEVRAILLGREALLTIAAIPVGWALGVAMCDWIARAVTSDLFRLPVVISPKTFATAMVVVLAASSLTALAVAGQLGRLDLVETLKTGE
ncbi:MAG TPA: FtsX-like permease family protein [Candidatus Acidoferrales bacterium]|nr:FtsX-like permease family protein [Candidatus Acidoferrales bacterium]